MSNTIYNNVVLGNKYNSVLDTKLNIQNFLTVDDTLAEDAGMTKRINTRTVTGSVEDLAMGVGNSGNIEVATVSNDYVVGTTQGRFVYYDEEAMTDDKAIDNGITGLGEKMVNSFTSKAMDEWCKASLQQGYSTIGFDTVVDAIAKLNLEDETVLFMLIAPNMVAAFRKALKDDLKYSESFVKTGYIGSVCGVPVYISKSCHNGEAIIATKEAVTLFVKKDTEIEQERDANLRKNTVYARKVSVVALTDATKVVRIAKNATTAATITTYTKAQKTVAGAATTGATVEIYINGVLDGTATAASSAYTYTAKANLAAGDEVKVIAKLVGEVDSTATVEVAA